MKAVVIASCILLSLGLKAKAQSEDETGLDEAFLRFLSEWAEAEEALDNMIVLDTLIDRAKPEQANKANSEQSNADSNNVSNKQKDKANSTRKEAHHDY